MAKRKKHVEHAGIVKGFAERLRDVRREKGMRQADLARAAHISESYVRTLEAARAACSIDLLDRLANALGTTPAALLPVAVPPDDLTVLREQIRRQVERIVESDDRQSLTLLSQLLARVSETTPRSSS